MGVAGEKKKKKKSDLPKQGAKRTELELIDRVNERRGSNLSDAAASS